MSFYQFLMIWLTCGMLMIAMRPGMIYTNPHKSHRFTMLIICAAFGIVVNVIVALVTGIRNFVCFWIDTLNGKEPK